MLNEIQTQTEAVRSSLFPFLLLLLSTSPGPLPPSQSTSPSFLYPAPPVTPTSPTMAALARCDIFTNWNGNESSHRTTGEAGAGGWEGKEPLCVNVVGPLLVGVVMK